MSDVNLIFVLREFDRPAIDAPRLATVAAAPWIR
jgi:hypothetical protein